MNQLGQVDTILQREPHRGVHVAGDDLLRVLARHPDVLADLLHDLVLEPAEPVGDALGRQQFDLRVSIGRRVRRRGAGQAPDPADNPPGFLLIANLVGHLPAGGLRVAQHGQLVDHDQVNVMPLGQVVGDDLHAVMVDDVKIERFVGEEAQPLLPTAMQYCIVEVREVAEDFIPPGPLQCRQRCDDQGAVDPFLVLEVVVGPQGRDGFAGAHVVQAERSRVQSQHVDGGALHLERIVLAGPVVVVLNRARHLEAQVLQDQGLVESVRDQGDRGAPPVHDLGVRDDFRDLTGVPQLERNSAFVR